MKLYDENYEKCECFWGKKPAELVKEAVRKAKEDHPNRLLKAIDLGCGEGKNANFVSENGIHIIGIDESEIAIRHANLLWKDTSALFISTDMQLVNAATSSFDIVISTGSIHCLEKESEVDFMIKKMKNILKPNGYIVLSTFNNRKQNFEGHPASFNPILLAHDFFTSYFIDYEIIHSSDKDLLDKHPDTNIEHIHSITRILAKKIK